MMGELEFGDENYEFEYGQRVRVIRTIRNDGTFPGRATGNRLVRAGSVGFVRNVGTFLQDQIIYTVHFTEEDIQVGCRDQELIDADEPWQSARFEFRDKVRARISLAVSGRVVVEPGTTGEVTKVHRAAASGPAYEVYFAGRTLMVPERALESV